MRIIKLGDTVLVRHTDGKKSQAKIVTIEVCKPGEKYGRKVNSTDIDTHHGVIDLSTDKWVYFHQIIKIIKDA